MRRSGNPDDCGYVNPQEGARTFVFLDGVELRDVITADDEEGMVVQAKRDEKGLLVVDYIAGEVVTETRYGAVRFEVRP